MTTEPEVQEPTSSNVFLQKAEVDGEYENEEFTPFDRCVQQPPTMYKFSRTRSLLDMADLVKDENLAKNMENVASSDAAKEYVQKIDIPDGSNLLFEVGTEVASKSGGIYTVLKSKAAKTKADWGYRYCLIGIYKPQAAAVEFEELPLEPYLEHTFHTLQSRGCKLYYGRWLIDGFPRCILIDIHQCYNHLNDWKKDMWERFNYSSPPDNNDPETNDTILFGYQVFWLLETFCNQHRQWAVVAHFHEWLSGVSIPLLRQNRVPVALVFTTHATLLGRYMCAGKTDFYNCLRYVNPSKEAGKRQIYHRHKLENMAAHGAHVFTTVSRITALEAEHIHQRTPDMILPNGINVEKLEGLHEFQNLHFKYREKIDEFVRGHFYGHISFDLEKTVYVFSAGRFEYFNKGYDMFIEALARLNALLKSDPNNDITVVGFIITRAKTDNYNIETLKGASLQKVMRQQTESINTEMSDRIFNCIMNGRLPRTKDLIREDEMLSLRRRLMTMKRSTLPPVTTHNIVGDGDDPIIQQIRKVGLFNDENDPVKVVYHPDFLSAVSPVLPLDYTEFVRGAHLGVFCSYYEPWGLTPAECAVMGVPSVTSNLAGFGDYIQQNLQSHGDNGMFVVDRRFCSPEDSMTQLVQVLKHIAFMSKSERIELRDRTVIASQMLDWEALGSHYETARAEAIRRMKADLQI
eukprot:GCRY01001293.1.p1 GENE.GCRY01001293.1~~GCRY01001293.1.p1  ORF type:complete len:689 (-),score=130.20 GCRY01001293.1:459-2525(-)